MLGSDIKLNAYATGVPRAALRSAQHHSLEGNPASAPQCPPHFGMYAT
jgi:hypothetical protein